MADDIVTRLRARCRKDSQPCQYATCYGYCASLEAADIIEKQGEEIMHLHAILNDFERRLDAVEPAGDALADLVRRRLPHHGWTTADREVASVVLDAWEEARRG